MKETAEKVLKPIGNILAVIADKFHALCEIIQAGYDAFIKPLFDVIGQKLSAFWGEHLQPMWEKIAGFLGRIGEIFKALWDKAQPFVEGIKKIIGVLGELFKPIADLLGDVIFSELGRLFDAIGMIFDVLSGLIDFVVGVFTGEQERRFSRLGMAEIFLFVCRRYFRRSMASP